MRQRLGILAGGGSLPLEIARCAAAHGADVHVVAIDGEADADFGDLPVSRVNWGEVGGMVRALKEAGVEDLVIVGRVHRPDLLKLRTDLGFFLNLPAILRIIAAGGDDSVLRRVVRFFEGHGFRVLSPADAAPELVLGQTNLGDAAPSEQDAADIAHGFAVVRALGPYDIGQSVIVRGRAVVAIEGAEGTDRMLARAAADARARGGTLVKRSKPGQDLRVDMPAIGPETVTRAMEAGLAGIAVEAERVLVAERAETQRRADDAGIFVAGCTDTDKAAPQESPARAPLFERLGRHAPVRSTEADIAKGAAVIASLAPFGTGRAVVVVRRHVLAVEAGEGARETVERAARLKQWGRATALGRRGAAVLADIGGLTDDLLRAAAAAGLAGVAAMTGRRDAVRLRDVIAVADKLRLFVAARRDDEGAGG